MMKNNMLPAYVIFFFILSIQAIGQNNIGTTYCNHNDLNASRYQPSELDLKNKRVQIGFNYNLWIGNSTFQYKSANAIYETGVITDENISFLIGKLDKKNIFGAGEDFQLLGFAFQNKSEKGKKYDISISVVEKSGANFLYTDNFMKLALKGNKQFAGQTVNLGPFAMNAQYRREYVIGTAFPVFDSGNGFGLRFGIRGKFIQGIGALYMPRANASMYTDAQGRYIDVNYDYEVKTSGMKNFSPFKYSGKGYGLDLGATLFLTKNFQVVASVLNLGSIYYNKSTHIYTKSGRVHYDGMAVEGFFGGKNDKDSLQKIFDPNISQGETFKMPLDTKISIEGELKTSKKDKDGREYVSNAVFFTYVQGLNNMPGATTRPFFSLGYNHNFHRFFNGGLSASAGGYNRYAMGAFFALNFAQTVKVGFSSDNLAALVFSRYGTGVDFAFNFSISLK